jgi:hypothetical protein
MIEAMRATKIRALPKRTIIPPEMNYLKNVNGRARIFASNITWLRVLGREEASVLKTEIRDVRFFHNERQRRINKIPEPGEKNSPKHSGTPNNDICAIPAYTSRPPRAEREVATQAWSIDILFSFIRFSSWTKNPSLDQRHPASR